MKSKSPYRHIKVNSHDTHNFKDLFDRISLNESEPNILIVKCL